MKRDFLFYFLLSLLGYSIYVIMDAIGKKLIGTYHVSQIIFINSIFALLPIAIFVTYKKEWAEVKKYNLKIGVVNFDPMPKMFFNKKLKNFRLSNIDQKIKLLSKLKVDFVITKKFDKKFSKTKALNFISQILNKKLSSKFIFVSNNFRFGNKREGNVNLLKKYEKLFNYQVVKPEPLIKSKKIVSSSLIRNLLEKGLLDKANNLLKRNWTIQGVVKRGRQVGEKIGRMKDADGDRVISTRITKLPEKEDQEFPIVFLLSEQFQNQLLEDPKKSSWIKSLLKFSK